MYLVRRVVTGLVFVAGLAGLIFSQGCASERANNNFGACLAKEPASTAWRCANPENTINIVGKVLTLNQMESLYGLISPEGRVNASERKYAETHGNVDKIIPYDEIHHTH